MQTGRRQCLASLFAQRLDPGQRLARLIAQRQHVGLTVVGRMGLPKLGATPHGLAYMEGPLLGFDTSFDLVDDLFPAYLVSLATHPYPFDGTVFGFPAANVELHRQPYAGDVLHLRVQGKFGDNAPPRRLVSEIVRQWNETWAYPTLRVSRNEDFFAEAERRTHNIPTFQRDWIDWWADGVGSGARPLQLVRRAQAVLSDAQTVSSVAGHSEPPARSTTHAKPRRCIWLPRCSMSRWSRRPCASRCPAERLELTFRWCQAAPSTCA
jgi:hypothetical protein